MGLRDGSDLKKARISARISQADLAKDLGVSQALVSMLEAGRYENEPLYREAIAYLDRIADGKNRLEITSGFSASLLKRVVKHKRAGAINWSWATFSSTAISSDVFECVDLSPSDHAVIVADVAGSGARGSVSAAQIKFGFTALAHAISPNINFPTSYSFPLGMTLKNISPRKAVAPGVGIFCINSRKLLVTSSVIGLPSPVLCKKTQDAELANWQVDSADVIWSDVKAPQVNYHYLDRGDSITIYTDGFWQWLKETKGLSTSQVNDLILEAATNFSGDAHRIINSILGAGMSGIEFATKDDATICVIGNSKKKKRG